MPILQYNATKNNDYGAGAASSDPYFNYQTYSYTISEGVLGNVSVIDITGCSMTNANTNGSSSTGAWKMQIEAALNGNWYALGYILVTTRYTSHMTFNNFVSTADSTIKSLMGKHAITGLRGKVIEGYFHLNIGSQITLTATTTEEYRVSTFTCSPATVDAGSNVTVNISRMSANLTHTVLFVLGAASREFTGVATSQSLTIPMDWLYQMTDTEAKACIVTVSTYAGAQPIGQISSSFIIRAGDTIKPMLDSLVAAPVDGHWGLYVQGYSRAQLTAIGAAGVYGSIPMSYSIAGGTTNPTVTGVLNASATFYATVTDSRGRTSSPASCTVDVTQYAPPNVTSLTVTRASDDLGHFSEDGMYCKVTPMYSWSPIGGNARIITVAYQPPGTDWVIDSTDVIESNGSVVLGSGSTFALDKSYAIRFTITDQIATTVIAYATLPTAAYTMDFMALGKGVAVGQVATVQNAFEVAANWKLRAYGYEIGVPSNPNLLINGNFRQMINQRGGYDYTTNSKYTVDRWLLTYNAPGGHLAVGDGYIHLFAPPAGLSDIAQIVEFPNRYPAGYYTLTCELNLTGGTTQLIVWDGSNSLGTLWLTANGSGWKKYSSTFQLSGLQAQIIVIMRTFDGGHVAIREAKLEPGSISTPLSPRLYAEELVICKRYYIDLTQGSDFFVGKYASGGWLIVEIPLPSGMRINTPIINYVSPPEVYTDIGAWTVIPIYKVVAYNNMAYVYFTAIANMTPGKCYPLRYLSGLDAEIY